MVLFLLAYFSLCASEPGSGGKAAHTHYFNQYIANLCWIKTNNLNLGIANKNLSIKKLRLNGYGKIHRRAIHSSAILRAPTVPTVPDLRFFKITSGVIPEKFKNVPALDLEVQLDNNRVRLGNKINEMKTFLGAPPVDFSQVEDCRVEIINMTEKSDELSETIRLKTGRLMIGSFPDIDLDELQNFFTTLLSPDL